MKRGIKKLFILMITGILIAGASGCLDNGTDDQKIYGSGNIISENRPVQSFNSINVDGTADVRLIPSDKNELKIEADDNIIDKVVTEVKNGKLYIYLERGSYTNVTIKAYVSIVNLEELECKGSASFISEKPFNINTLRCLINGTANIKLAGKANSEIIEIDGAGNISNFDLETREATVNINGTGSVQVTATEKLNATISGTGSITFAGDPAVVNQKINGVGSINKRR